MNLGYKSLLLMALAVLALGSTVAYAASTVGHAGAPPSSPPHCGRCSY